jgi:hypothetical protein
MMRARVLRGEDCLAQRVAQLDRRIQRQRGQRVIPITEAGGVVISGLKIDDDAVGNRNDLNFAECPVYGTKKSCVMQSMLTHGIAPSIFGRVAVFTALPPTECREPPGTVWLTRRLFLLFNLHLLQHLQYLTGRLRESSQFNPRFRQSRQHLVVVSCTPSDGGCAAIAWEAISEAKAVAKNMNFTAISFVYININTHAERCRAHSLQRLRCGYADHAPARPLDVVEKI